MEALHPKNEKLRELFVTEICEISAPKCIHMKNLQLCAVDMHWISVISADKLLRRNNNLKPSPFGFLSLLRGNPIFSLENGASLVSE